MCKGEILLGAGPSPAPRTPEALVLSMGQQDASDLQVSWEALVKHVPEEPGMC